MSEFETAIEKAVAEQEIPGCVLLATNRDGSFTYNKSFGTRSLRTDGDQSALDPSTVMWIASCTKVMTSICATQLVERGLVTLDEPVYKYIPELVDFPVIKGFNEDGSPIEESHKTPITLRLLLTHTSGLAYEGMNVPQAKWQAYHSKGPSTASRIVERWDLPLIFEPGASWMYGPSLDYAGLLIERVTKQSLEEYMKANIWEPLGIKDATFFLSKRKDLKDRFADMSLRDAGTGKVAFTDERQSYQDADKNEVLDFMGGQGVFTSPEEYIKVLHAILTCDENEKLLKKSSLDEFFKPQLSEAGVTGLGQLLSIEQANNAMGGILQQIPKNWGLGGILICGDIPNGMKEGTMMWGGLPNLIWVFKFVDRKTGLCGIFAAQVLPTGDNICAALNRQFEAGIYEMYEKHQSENARH